MDEIDTHITLGTQVSYPFYDVRTAMEISGPCCIYVVLLYLCCKDKT